MRRTPPEAGADCWAREDPADTKPAGGDDGCEGLLGGRAAPRARLAVRMLPRPAPAPDAPWRPPGSGPLRVLPYSIIHSGGRHLAGDAQTRRRFMLGTEDRTAEIHDSLLSKCVVSSFCDCYRKDILFCAITAVEWSPTGNSYVIGCSSGMINSYTIDNEPIHCRRVAFSAILFLRVSPDARYIAAAAFNTDTVHLLRWPSLEYYSVLNSSNWTIKTITWHPWRSALLAVGAVTTNIHARIALWDAPAARVREYALSHKHYYIDAMLFSHRTGELVVSLWNPGIILYTFIS
ncbi:unnamed protein product [Parnassius apollo]|uniref:(apollo) hypothetical protein n=1 Tax=Parnassius apollo TaxID=110799 RepID=A0A8S3Y8Y4_PARAO|nr:unnamed protein product [Parnassius apollo]